MPNVPPDCIRLSAGYPSPTLIPWKQLGDSVQLLLQEEQDLPLQYLGSVRKTHLRTQIQQRLMQRGITVPEHCLLITSGAAQAIDLIANTLLDTTTPVAVEAPTYMEALETFRNYTNYFIDIPVDDQGLNTDALEKLFVKRMRSKLPLPRLLYTIPSFQNPTGATMNLKRRKRLLELASEFDFLILEDDAYGELAFNEPPQTLKALDEEERVIHVGSLSKLIAPGLRIGWVAGSQPLISSLGWFKKDLEHSFVEAATATYLAEINWEERLSMLRNSYRNRRDVMLRVLERCMPQGVTWSKPNGGFFVWLHIPGIDTTLLLPKALELGVSYVPGRHFFHNPNDGSEFLRLSFSHEESELTVQGVERLADVINSAISTIK